MKIVDESMNVLRGTIDALEISNMLGMMSAEDISLASNDLRCFGSSFVRVVDGRVIRIDPQMVMINDQKV